jgi:hypothetical protein
MPNMVGVLNDPKGNRLSIIRVGVNSLIELLVG